MWTRIANSGFVSVEVSKIRVSSLHSICTNSRVLSKLRVFSILSILSIVSISQYPCIISIFLWIARTRRFRVKYHCLPNLVLDDEFNANFAFRGLGVRDSPKLKFVIMRYIALTVEDHLGFGQTKSEYGVTGV